MSECIFCQVAAYSVPAKIIRDWGKTIAFIPLNPVTEGHVLVIPKIHVEDFAESPEITAKTMQRATELFNESRYKDCNLITSKGVDATQSIFHLHIHIVPRFKGDGLHLPWANQLRTTLEEIK